MLKFICECGHDKFNMFSHNENHTSFVGTCAKCGWYWTALDSLEKLRTEMTDAGVLK